MEHRGDRVESSRRTKQRTPRQTSIKTRKGARGASVDPEEIEKFTALAEAWWDPDGEFRPLHRLNPTRLRYIRDQAGRHFGLDAHTLRPFEGLRVLDIGCGGGLLAEPMARLGGAVTAIDASERNITIAARHARTSGLKIRYLATTAEALAEKGQIFDIVLNMEVIEHVADVESFLAAATTLLAPGGLSIVATLNRTPKSFLAAIVGAEYLLRWLPRGTHDWRRFLRPSELAAALRATGLEVVDLSGVVYNPVGDSWRLAPRDLEVNYMMAATRPATAGGRKVHASSD
jgi:2-polyprenyl-6-hydroxyphenyl methylase/3-demethylubiquinone-9 3-methyltransferase